MSTGARKSEATPTRAALEAAHARASASLGELALALERDSVGRARMLGWALELRGAAEDLERLAGTERRGGGA